MTAADPSHIPQLWLERYALGELPEPHRSRVEAALAADPALAARLEALRADTAATLATYPAATVAAQVGHRLRAAKAAQQPPTRWVIPAMGAVASVAAAIALVLALPGPEPGPGHAPPSTLLEPPDTIRLKGAEQPRLTLDRKTPTGAEPLHDGDTAAEGDTLMVRYLPQRAAYGVIVSLDGRGVASLHVPEKEDGDTALLQGAPGAVDAPNAFRLDDAPRFERFFFVTAQRPLSPAEVLRAARSLSPDQAERAALPLGDDVQQTSLLIRKVPR